MRPGQFMLIISRCGIYLLNGKKIVHKTSVQGQHVISVGNPAALGNRTGQSRGFTTGNKDPVASEEKKKPNYLLFLPTSTLYYHYPFRALMFYT